MPAHPTHHILRTVRGAYIVTGLVVLGLITMTWMAGRAFFRAEAAVVHTQVVLTEVSRLESSLYRAAAGQRSYLLTQEAAYAQDRDQAIRVTKEALQVLKWLTADNATQQVRLGTLDHALQERFGIFAANARIRDTRGLVALSLALKGQSLISSQCGPIFSGMVQEETRMLAARQAERAYWTRLTFVAFGSFVLVLFLLLPISYVRMRTEIRRQAEAELRRQQLSEIIESAPSLVGMADQEQKVLYINPAGRRLLGLGLMEDLSWLHIADLQPQGIGDKEKEDVLARLLASGGTWTGESLFQARDGRRIPTSQVIMSHPQPEGGMILSTIAQDLTANKEANAKLAAASRLELSQARALDLFNREHTRAGVLRGLMALLEKSHAIPVSAFYGFDTLGGTLRLLETRGMVSAKPLVRLGEGPLGEAALGGEPIFLEEFDPESGFPIELGLASLRPMAMGFQPVFHREVLQGVLALAFLRPLTTETRTFLAQLAGQLGIALSNLAQVDDLHSLARELQARGEEIQAKNAQLEEASRMKSEFLASMSHELRTPLNAIIGFSEVLKDGLLGPLAQEQNKYIAEIFVSGHHLLSLINDILDLSKVEAGMMSLDPEPVDLAALVANGLTIVRERASTNGLRLVDESSADLGMVRLDLRKAKQILYNLLSNAVKFTPSGGTVTLALRRRSRGELALGAETPEARVFPPGAGAGLDFLEISVRDTGIGLAPEALQKIFQPFVQIESSLARSFGGTGLGLSLVRGLVALFDGGLRVDSRVGEGSRFTVWLPWHPVPALADESAAAAAPVAPGVLKRVLLVEDDAVAAAFYQEHLQAEGYQVRVVASAEEGLAAAQEAPPEAIILDIILPGMDGWAMLQALKATPGTRDIPVVIVSVLDDPGRGLALGANQVLLKPVTKEDLSNAMAALGFRTGRPGMGGGRILVVDDDPKTVELVTLQLKDMGFSPLKAFGGREGLDLARSEAPDAVILDMLMPDLSGFEVAEALAAAPRTAKIPILVLSNMSLSAEDRRRLGVQARAVLAKREYHPDHLLAELRRAMAWAGQARGTDEARQ